MEINIGLIVNGLRGIGECLKEGSKTIDSMDNLEREAFIGMSNLYEKTMEMVGNDLEKGRMKEETVKTYLDFFQSYQFYMSIGEE